jgi:hypothetical protein
MVFEWSTYLRNNILEEILRGTAFSPGGTLYVGLHFATTLIVDADAGQDELITDDVISIGSTITMNPGGSPTETHIVINSSGAGPYTITLDDDLTNNYLQDDYVMFEPGVNGADMKEPVGDGYARISITRDTVDWGATVGGQILNQKQLTFPTPTAEWGKVTHVHLGEDLTGLATIWFFGALDTFPVLDAASAPIQIVPGNLLVRIGPSST